MAKLVRKRALRYVETSDYLLACERMLRAAGRRVHDSDEEELGQLFRLEQLLVDILENAVAGLRDSGATWQTVGDAAGTTRQGAQQRWGARLAQRSSNGVAR